MWGWSLLLPWQLALALSVPALSSFLNFITLNIALICSHKETLPTLVGLVAPSPWGPFAATHSTHKLFAVLFGPQPQVFCSQVADAWWDSGLQRLSGSALPRHLVTLFPRALLLCQLCAPELSSYASCQRHPAAGGNCAARLRFLKARKVTRL